MGASEQQCSEYSDHSLPTRALPKGKARPPLTPPAGGGLPQKKNHLLSQASGKNKKNTSKSNDRLEMVTFLMQRKTVLYRAWD